MRSKLALFLLIVIAVAGATVGIVVARADQGPGLSSIDAADLLVRMAGSDQSGRSLSGSVSWTNDLFGQSGLIDTGQYGAAQSPLLVSGSGRVWFQGGNLRLESQGQGGDQIAVFNKDKHTLWTYTYVGNTATEYKLPAKADATGAATALPEPSPTGTFGPADIQKYIEQMATTAKVDVTGQTTVAGREAYILELTPTATDTALGRVQVAVDGHTYLPLRLQVFAKGSDNATISFAFDSISYDRIDSSLFSFTPPLDAKVTHEDLAAQADKWQGKDDAQANAEAPWSGADKAGQHPGNHQEPKPLTVAQAQAKVDFTVVSPQGYETVRTFQGAWVADRAQIKKQLEAFQKVNGGSDGQAPPASEPAQKAPQVDPAKLPQQAVVMQYGKGFGAIWFAQASSTPEFDKQLAKLPQQLAKEQIAGHQAWKLSTPLGGIVVWKQGDLTLAAGGMVTASDLNAFVAAVQ